MMIRKFAFIVLLLAMHSGIAQTAEEKQKANDFCLLGIKEMDKGEIVHAIEYLEKAKSLDPGSFYYPYEIAHCHFLTRDYKKAIQILNPLLIHKDVTDHAFHLLGSCYENSKNHARALGAFQAGLEKFPNSGLLYYELGNLYLNKKNYKEALHNYEKGISVDPDFSLNYFWASKIHSSLEDKLWGLMYAEIFINMEGVSEKSNELSKMMYDVYQKGITISSNEIFVDLSDSDTSSRNFEWEVEKELSESADNVDPTKGINIAAINTIKNTFIYQWIEKGNNDRYPNLLFDWYKLLVIKGYFESYNYWLLKEASPVEYTNWVSQHSKTYSEFEDWLSDNYLKPDASNYFIVNLYQY